jgi:DNA (cytosine-5)-methyltransferase 1
MFAVIRNTKPDWVIAENVRGLITLEQGMVFEQVCTDLESEGYEVQAFIIPAVAVNAPHRRDRIWIIGYSKHDGQYGTKNRKGDTSGSDNNPEGKDELRQLERTDRIRKNFTDSKRERPIGRSESCGVYGRRVETKGKRGELESWSTDARCNEINWNRNWQEIAFATCDDSLDDGLPRIVDGVPYSRAKWRKESLKCYGNAIVPQVAMEIFKAILTSN